MSYLGITGPLDSGWTDPTISPTDVPTTLIPPSALPADTIDSSGGNASVTGGSTDWFGSVVNDLGQLAAQVGTVVTLSQQGRPSTIYTGSGAPVPGYSTYGGLAGLSGNSTMLILLGILLVVIVALFAGRK